MSEQYSGEIGIIEGITILETHLYMRQKPRYFPSNWLWYTLAGIFTEQVSEPYRPTV